jgi:hypothetical protein
MIGEFSARTLMALLPDSTPASVSRWCPRDSRGILATVLVRALEECPRTREEMGCQSASTEEAI